MTLYNTKIWVDCLKEFIYNYNHSKHSVTELKPINALNINESQYENIKEKIINKSIKVNELNLPELIIGDYVQISNLKNSLF